MGYNKETHHRRSMRLNGYDYSHQGAYFVTICTQNRECQFGEIMNGVMIFNDAGTMVQSVWNELPTRFDNIILDECMIMPNHIHFIIVVSPRRGEPRVRPNTTTDICPNPSPNIDPNTNDNYTEDNHTNIGETGNNHQQNNRSHDDHTDNDYINKKHTDDNYLNNNRSDNHHTDNIHTLDDHKDRPYGTLTGSLGRIIQALKSITTHKYTTNVKQNEWTPFPGKLWQRNYWEHIVRDENELNRIRRYIQNNPKKWQTDKLNGSDKNIVMEKSAQYGEEIWMV